MQEIGYHIRKVREAKNLTQEYLADRLGISAKTYRRIENDEQDLTLSRLSKIAEVLEAGVDELLGMGGKQYFNQAHQSGNIHSVVNAQELTQHERQSYQQQIAHLQDEISFLRTLVRTV
jgi:transcriptional regulator with XRE-family HTH domain